MEGGVRKALRYLREGGGYITELTKPILKDVPPENAAMLIEVLAE